MAQALLPAPDALSLDAITVQAGIIVFQAHTTKEGAPCPECHCRSERVHSRYQRTLQDLPWQGNTVRFVLTVRRFFCGNGVCPRKIFAEPVDKVAMRYRRKTTRLEDVLLQLTWRLGAAGAAQIARLIGLLLSSDAVLYRFKKSAPAQARVEAPEVLGIDDFAFRRGHRYGTLLIDLKTSTPVDLLPDRERASVEKWLKEHPGAKIISRDRSAVFADAIREAAPDAIAVADRFHLLKNLMEAMQTQIGKENQAIRDVLVPKVPPSEDEGPVTQARRVQRASQESRQRRFERWQKVHALFGQGYFKKEIARMTDLDIHTVRTYLLSPTFPEHRRHSPVNGPLAPYKEYLLQRWEEGCQNALQLWREVKQQGYTGCATAVRDFVVPLRKPGMTPAIKRAERSVPSPRALSWLLILPERRTPEQSEMVENLCATCPTLVQCRDLVLSFQDLMRRRAAAELEGWLEQAKASGLATFATFVRGIRSDQAAVLAAFSLPWSNGPTEGHVNRLKFLKRQGYGRASFDLLRRRVLPLPA
jgi:transposase